MKLKALIIGGGITAVIVAAIAVAVAPYTLKVDVDLVPKQVAADHKPILPERDSLCETVHEARNIYDQLKHEHGWKGMPAPDENPGTYNYRAIPRFQVESMVSGYRAWPRSTSHHWQLYYQDVARMLAHAVVVDAWHGIVLETF